MDVVKKLKQSNFSNITAIEIKVIFKFINVNSSSGDRESVSTWELSDFFKTFSF